MKKTTILLLCLLTMALSIEGKDKATVTLKKVQKGWAKKSIRVNRGVDLPNVMQLVKAFHAQWPTTSVESLIAEAGDRRFVSNDVTDCDDCTGHVLVDCDDFHCASYDNGEAGSQRMNARAYYRENGHTLLAICLEEAGAPFCCLYDYNPATQTLTPEQAPYSTFTPKWSNSQIHYHLGMGYDQTVIVQETLPDGDEWYHHYVFDGTNHVYHHSGADFYNLVEDECEDDCEDDCEDEHDMLPLNTILKDQTEDVELRISYDESENLQVWKKDKHSTRTKLLLTANNNAEARWDEMLDGCGITVPLDQIAIGECYHCFFVPWDHNLIFMSGCPDGRNVWTYTININDMTAVQFPSNAGFVDIDENKELIYMSNYEYYPEGGRYWVVREYTVYGNFTGNERMADE